MSTIIYKGYLIEITIDKYKVYNMNKQEYIDGAIFDKYNEVKAYIDNIISKE